MQRHLIFILNLIIIYISCRTQSTDTMPSQNDHTDRSVATLGGGCFWCLEAVFQQLKGVDTVISGYAGGHVPNPTYEQVCSGKTGHAEVIQIHYNQNIITFDELLDVFFHIHDPTQLNRQGNDIGTQYRSVIFYHDEHQKNAAIAYINKLNQNNMYGKPIVTELSPFTRFFPAESYHQNYYNTHPNQPYCTYVIMPKLKKFQKDFSDQLK